MNRNFRFVRSSLFTCLVLILFVSFADASKPKNISPARFQAAVRQLLRDPALSRADIGISIVDVRTGKRLFEQNSRKFFHPASTTKLFTTAAALGLLGADWIVTTSAGYEGEIAAGTLKGNLVVRGGGDPLLRVDELDSLSLAIVRAGIASVSGDLVANTVLFDTAAWGKGWMWDDEPSADAAFISPLTVNRGAIEVTVAPAPAVSSPALIALNPPTTYCDVINRTMTAVDPTSRPIEVLRPHGTNQLIVTGVIAPGAASFSAEVSVSQPPSFVLHMLREQLTARGIRVAGRLRTDSVDHAKPIADIRRRLDSIVTFVNKESYNLGAECLLRLVSASNGRTRGNDDTGITIVRSYLAGIGVDTSGVLLVDGSGESWYNVATPESFTQLLRAIDRNRSLRGPFVRSLPVGGIDGTLQHRLKGIRGGTSVHAKTGTLTGVSTLAGYATTASGGIVAFSIMCEHLPERTTLFRALQDNILGLLASVRAGT